MIRRKRKQFKVKFTGKKHSVQGIASAIVGFLAIAVSIALVAISTNAGGNSGRVLGLAGFCLAALTVAGIVLSAISFKQKDIYYTWSIVGMVINAVLFLILVFLYFLGLSI